MLVVDDYFSTSACSPSFRKRRRERGEAEDEYCENEGMMMTKWIVT
jgi:hypothetical protein